VLTTQLLVRSARRVVRSVLIPTLTVLLLLGLTPSGPGSFCLTPAASRIASELRLHHRLPVGTTLSVGSKADPLTVRLDGDGRLSISTPRTVNFGGLVSAGIGQADKLASSSHLEIPATLAASANR
jgi:hypothetical protein